MGLKNVGGGTEDLDAESTEYKHADARVQLQEAGILGLLATHIPMCTSEENHRCPAGFQVTGGYHCKKHKGCRSDVPFPEGSCKSSDQCRIFPTCGDKADQCPATYRKTGGFHCKKHKGCRSDKEGPFPEASCKSSDQCYIWPGSAAKTKKRMDNGMVVVEEVAW